MKLNIIGAGRVGQTLGRLFSDRNTFKVASVFNRTEDKAQEAVDFIGSGDPICDFTFLKSADVYLISTPDNALASTCRKLASQHHFQSDSIVFHCSGVTPSSILEPLSSKGCKLASVHPIKSFADPNIAISNFDGTFCGVEGDSFSLSVLEEAFSVIGGNTFRIDRNKKPIYHAATSMACNNLVGLIEVSINMYMDAGLDRAQALKVIEPIIKGTITNVLNLDTTEALTGPIARGDDETIEAHLSALVDDDLSRISYSALGLWVLKLAKQQGSAGKESLGRIADLLKHSLNFEHNTIEHEQ